MTVPHRPLANDCPLSSLDQVAGPGWLAVGDAASAFDPISSGGIYKALSDGLAGAVAVAAALAGNPTAAADYAARAQTRYQHYSAVKLQFYEQEAVRRGPGFWQNRVTREGRPRQQTGVS